MQKYLLQRNIKEYIESKTKMISQTLGSVWIMHNAKLSRSIYLIYNRLNLIRKVCTTSNITRQHNTKQKKKELLLTITTIDFEMFIFCWLTWNIRWQFSCQATRVLNNKLFLFQWNSSDNNSKNICLDFYNLSFLFEVFSTFFFFFCEFFNLTSISSNSDKGCALWMRA